jgi:Ca2+-binding EF-hand superfamily protein
VPLEDIEEMFTYADQDCDGKISWSEFQTMINPPKPPEPPKPTLADFAVKVKMEKPQTLSVSKMMSESISISSNCAEASWGSVLRGTPT